MINLPVVITKLYSIKGHRPLLSRILVRSVIGVCFDRSNHIAQGYPCLASSGVKIVLHFLDPVLVIGSREGIRVIQFGVSILLPSGSINLHDELRNQVLIQET